MSIEKITSKIIDDAKKNADTVLDQARAESDEILANASKKAEEVKKNAEIQGAEEKGKLVSRRKAVADIDGRKTILQEKQRLIAKCFDSAIEKITSMEKKAYIDFLAETVKSTGETEGELILNERDYKDVGAELVKQLSKGSAGSSITLSKEIRDIKGGFLLKKGSVYINGTVEALVDEAREELTGEVAKQLFG